MAKRILKDPYVVDFLLLNKPLRKRELELGLIQHLEKIPLKRGIRFAYLEGNISPFSLKYR
jgi:predicted nuclease of restriction endonuclease-like (RecB) superfamily